MAKKIKVEKQIFRGYNTRQLKWSDIKHLELEDDDLIHSGWVEDEGFEYHGYWHNEIVRMVEETDEQFEKRIADNKRTAKLLKERRYENYLKLKAEFEK